MSKPDHKEVKLEIRLPQKWFPRRMYFNRFRVERENGFRFIQFGLLVSSDLVDSFSCSLSNPVLDQHKKTLLEYLARIGAPGSEDDTPWKGTPANRETTVADVITMAYHGEMSEICFYGFSMNAATVSARAGTGEQIEAQPLAVLRSGTQLQRHIIAALYEE